MSEAKKVAPMKRNTPRKGSPEAYAWAREMKAARERKARHNPARRKKGVIVALRKYSGGVSITIIQTSASRYTVVMDDASKSSLQYRNQVQGVYNSLEKAEQLADFIEVNQLAHLDRLNPGASYHAAEAEQAEAQERRAARGGKVTQAAFQRGKASAHRQSEMKARELKLNPIAVFGNPGSRVQAKIEGIIYSRCIEIRAEKTHHKPGLYRHPFNKKSRAVIFGLDNGSILIQSMNGTRLWGEDSDL
jgi:hypothetical protein